MAGSQRVMFSQFVAFFVIYLQFFNEVRTVLIFLIAVGYQMLKEVKTLNLINNLVAFGYTQIAISVKWRILQNFSTRNLLMSYIFYLVFMAKISNCLLC